MFSEVREYAQSPSVCSAVFPIQWDGGWRSEGSRVLSSPFASSNCSWVRSSAPERFDNERSAPDRFPPLRTARERFALRRSAPARSAKERSGCKEGLRLGHAFH